MIVLGMSGKLGVGKNYVSDKYVIPKLMEMFGDDYTVVPYYFSFGSFIKTEIYGRDMTDTLSFRNLFIKKTSSVRKHLQTYGTEMGRHHIREDLWIRHVDMWIQIQTYQLRQLPVLKKKILPLFVIQDIRFKNEWTYVQNLANSILLRVHAPSRNKSRCESEQANSQHASETDLDRVPFPYTIHNDPWDEDVQEQVNAILQEVAPKIDLKIYEDIGKDE